MKPHVVRQGETVASIIARMGGTAADVDSTWNASQNDDLRELRGDPAVLFAGDILYVPDLKTTWLPVSVGSTNTFKAKIPTEPVKIVLTGEDALAGEPYVIKGIGADIPGTTDGSGAVTVDVPVTQKSFVLELPKLGHSYRVMVGHLDPVTEDSGVAQRLSNMGYTSVLAQHAFGPQSRILGLIMFQVENGLPPRNGLLLPNLPVAPSVAQNTAAPPPASLLPVLEYYGLLWTATVNLMQMLEDTVKHATGEIAGAVAATRVVSGIAHAVQDTLPYQEGMGPKDVEGCQSLCAKADALLDAATKAAGSDMDARKINSNLAGDVADCEAKVMNLLHDPGWMAKIKAFQDDATVPQATRTFEMMSINATTSKAVEVLAHSSRSQEIADMAEAILKGHDTSTVPGLVIEAQTSLWKGFVQATLTATGAVGNLPAPDSLSMVFLKIYAVVRLPSAALSPAAAAGHYSEVFTMLVNAAQLSGDQAGKLSQLMDELKAAENEVIRTRMNQARDEARFPNNYNRSQKRARQRLQAEDTCDEKVAAAKEFMREAYGPKNEKLYSALERGPFIDSFVSALCIVQLLGAFGEFFDEKISAAQAAVDFAGSLALTAGAVIPTIHKLAVKLDLGIAKGNLARWGTVLEKNVSTVAVITGALVLISGIIQIYLWDSETTHKDKVLNKMQVASGACIVVGTVVAGLASGALMAALGSALTGIGVALGIILAIIAVIDIVTELLKSGPQQAIESVLSGLKKAKTRYDGKKIAELLGITGAIKALASAVDEWSPPMLVPNDNGSPTYDELVGRMRNLGFELEDAEKLIRDPAVVDRYRVPALGT